MRVYRSLSSVVATALLAHLGSVKAEIQLNGWYDCSTTDVNPADPTAAPIPFECAEARVPLCHEGICQSSKLIDVFVKRLPATSEEATPAKAIWMLQGGPGMSSVDLEGAMNTLHQALNGTASLYTMDHRGTGRSFMLRCDAAQAFTGGSPGGYTVRYDEVPDCVQDILFQIDGQTAAFSVTSAATDVVRLTAELNTDEEVYIYGSSYGTYLTERVMHLAPPHVKGYILDGVVSETSSSFATFGSKRSEPGKFYASLCEKDAVCSAKYAEGMAEHGDVYSLWKDTYAKLDAAKHGENACADFLRGNSTMSASDVMRVFLFGHSANPMTRESIPAFLAKMRRCEADDLAWCQTFAGTAEGQSVIEFFMEQSKTGQQKPVDDLHDNSMFLGTVIKSSELWTSPSPYEEEKKLGGEGVFTITPGEDYAWRCLLGGDWSEPACAVFEELNKMEGSTPVDSTNLELVAFQYTTDQYHHKAAAIPAGASVMVMNGKLDFQTVHSDAVKQYEEMVGESKILVEFETGPHCPGIVPISPADSTMCGFQIMANYIQASGDVAQVDTSCLEQIPPLNFDVEAEAPAAEATKHKKQHHAKKHTTKVADKHHNSKHKENKQHTKKAAKTHAKKETKTVKIHVHGKH